MGWSMDDAKTQRYIDRAMSENSSYKPIEHQLEMAWSGLVQKRDNEDPKGDDRELAAAEHYMYARWQVCSGKTGSVVMTTLTLGYDPAKLLGYVPAVFVIRKLAGHSWSRPSTDSMRWGMRGVSHGGADKDH